MNINPIKSISESKKIYYTNTVKKLSSFKGNGSDKLVSKNSNEKKKDNDLWEGLFCLGLIALLCIEDYSFLDKKSMENIDKWNELVQKDMKTLDKLEEMVKKGRKVKKGNIVLGKTREKVLNALEENKTLEKEIKNSKETLKTKTISSKELEKPEEAVVKELKKSLKKSVEQFKKVNK